MKLLVDRGNTRTKWRLISNGRLVSSGVEVGGLFELQRALQGLSLETALVACVAGDEVEQSIVDLVKGSCPEAAVVKVRTQQGFKQFQLAYSDVSTMGVDRWLQLVAVREKKAFPALVLSLGTAITVDKISADAQHQGGLIAPGWQMLRSVVQVQTARIDVEVPVEPRLANNALGGSTSECLHKGVSSMWSAFIEHIDQNFGADCQEKYVCGGDSAYLKERLSGFSKNENLVLDGLVVVASDIDEYQNCSQQAVNTRREDRK